MSRRPKLMRPWLRLTLAGVWALTAGINVMLTMLSLMLGSSWAVFNFLIAVLCGVMYFHNLRMFNDGE